MTTRTLVVPDDKTRARIPRRRRTDRGRRFAGSVLFHAVSIAVLIVLLYPAAWMVFSAFKPSNDIVGNVALIPDTWTLENFAQVFEGIAGMSFWRFAWNSLVLAVLTVVGVCLSSSVTAYAFARIDFTGRGIWFALMIGTLLLPFHVVIIPQYIVFNQLHLINTFTPLLIGRFLATEAFFVFLLVQFMRSVPRDLDEAARIDGAGHVRIFATIMLPLLRPALVTCSIFAFLNSWNDFFGPLLYLKSPDLYPLPIALRLYIDSTSASNFGAQMAMAVLSLLPVLLFFLIFPRYIVGGIATSGLKG
jgi:multiple sugar transport system permease protein